MCQVLHHYDCPGYSLMIPGTPEINNQLYLNIGGTITSVSSSGGGGSVYLSAVDQDIIPDGNGTRSLGSSSKRFKDIFLAGETINLGGLRDYKEDRYVIELDVEFAGGLYKDVEFTLDDREEKSKILFDRETMNRFNVMVNPNRKYIITTKYSLKDED